ncbi:MAG TPA: flagellar basal-body rod protein FlgG [Dissulfurispiraceae bacterium]|nr:flagellar basal-body rod protein FlgG [Dissulfurispiraceae bacterium]
MIRSLFTGATGMQAQSLNVDVISNNLANTNTTGYKKSRAEFQDLLYQTLRTPGGTSSEGNQFPSGMQVGLGVRSVAIMKNFLQGDFVTTGNPLDMVVEGEGFFQISRPDGTIAYSRAGAFKLDKDGRVVNSDGYPLEPAITIPSDTISITLSTDGRLTILQGGSTTPVEVGTIEISRFINPAGLLAVGKNLFLQTDASGDPITGAPGSEGRGTLVQGFLENSNVNLVEELANLIIAQRAFDVNSKSVQTSDEMLQTIIQLKR